MAFRIHEDVVRGEIDNTRRDVVTGKIWLSGWEQPLVLELAGNCWRDLAGCRCTFVNPKTNPKPTKDIGLAPNQTGEVGDITASRKVRVPDLPLDEWLERSRLGLEAPEHWGNSLYLEWYSDANGRVVVESADYNISVSLHEWEMTEEEEKRQHELNGEAMQRFMNRLEAALRPDDPVDVPEDREMDEHEWERFLQQCDAGTERLGELEDKFQDHPDRERMIAKHMGWDKILEQLNAPSSEDDNGYFEDKGELEDDVRHESSVPPGVEGVDWVEDESGRINHPLQRRCFKLSIGISSEVKRQGLLQSESGDVDQAVDDMCFNIQRASSKLAGALNPLARDEPASPAGFIIAYLKRSLVYINDALGAMSQVETNGLLPDQIREYRRETLEIRDWVIDLMNELRTD